MQGTYSQWHGEIPLIYQTCSYGYVKNSDGTWHWTASDATQFCGAGSPTPFWARSEGYHY